MATLDVAMEKEQKLRDDLLNLRWLYDTQKREDDSPTREYNLLQMLKLISRKEKQLQSLLGVREAKQIQEEIFTEEIVIDSILESIFESIMGSFNSEEVTDCSQDSSISSEATLDESADELVIPSFLFAEEKVDSQITEITKVEVNDVDRENPVQMKEVSYETLEILRELITTHSELNCKDFFTLLFDFTRSLFDRGKKIQLSLENSCFTDCYSEFGSQLDVCLKLLDGYYRQLVHESIYRHGYWSYSWFQDQIACMLANGSVSSTTWEFFVKMILMDTVCCEHHFVFNHTLPTGLNCYHYFKYADKVFDRGKEFLLIQGVISHQVAGEQSSYIGVNLTGSVYDRGRGIEPMGQHSSFDSDYRFCFGWVVSSGLFYLNAVSVSIAYYNGLSSKKAHKWSVQVQLQALPYHVLQPLVHCGVGFARYLTGAYMSLTKQSSQVNRFLNSASAQKFSCRIPRWSLTSGADNLSLSSAEMVFHLIVARQGTDVLLGELLGVSAVGHGHAITLPIIFKKFRYLSMLVSAVPRSVRVCLQCLRFSYLLPAPNVYSSSMMQVGIIMGTQILVEVLQILKMLLRVSYLRWKFRCVPPGLWSVTIVILVDKKFISVLCSGLKWDTASSNSVLVQILQDYEVQKAQEGFDRVHDSIWCIFSRSTDFLHLWLPTTVYHGVCKVELRVSSYRTLLPLDACVSPNSACCGMLFDRGKIGETVLWTSHSTMLDTTCAVLFQNFDNYTEMNNHGFVYIVARGIGMGTESVDSVVWNFTEGGFYFSGLLHEVFMLANMFSTQGTEIFKIIGDFSCFQEYTSLLMLILPGSCIKFLNVSFSLHYTWPISKFFIPEKCAQAFLNPVIGVVHYYLHYALHDLYGRYQFLSRSYQPMRWLFKLVFYGRVVDTEALLTLLYTRNVLEMVHFLKWKSFFRGLWSANEWWGMMNLTSVVCLMKTFWYYGKAPCKIILRYDLVWNLSTVVMVAGKELMFLASNTSTYLMDGYRRIVLSTTNYLDEMMKLQIALQLGVSSRWTLQAHFDTNIDCVLMRIPGQTYLFYGRVPSSFDTEVFKHLKITKVNTSGTYRDAYSTGCHEVKGPVFFGELNTKELTPWSILQEELIMDARLTCSLPGGQWTYGIGIGLWASPGFLMALSELGFSCVVGRAKTTIYIVYIRRWLSNF